MVALTGHAEAYFSDYMGTPQEFISSAKYGYLYQGQYYTWQKKNRGTPSLDLPAECFINYLQNHDQIANTCRGIRVHRLSGPGRYSRPYCSPSPCPQTPLIFQGQEFASSFSTTSPTTMKGNPKDRLRKKIFLSQFKSIASVNGPIGPSPQILMHLSKANSISVNERLMNSFTAFTATFWKSGKIIPCSEQADERVSMEQCLEERCFY